jgi:hypothetical protein
MSCTKRYASQILRLGEVDACNGGSDPRFVNKSGFCINLNPLAILLTLLPFLCLVLLDGMAFYHVSLPTLNSNHRF